MTNGNFIRVGFVPIYEKGPELSASADLQAADCRQRVRTLRELEFDHEQLQAGFRPSVIWKSAVHAVQRRIQFSWAVGKALRGSNSISGLRKF